MIEQAMDTDAHDANGIEAELKGVTDRIVEMIGELSQ